MNTAIVIKYAIIVFLSLIIFLIVNNSFLFSSRVETHGRASLREIYFQFPVYNFQFKKRVNVCLFLLESLTHLYNTSTGFSFAAFQKHKIFTA